MSSPHGIHHAVRLAAALGSLPASIGIRRRTYRLDIDAEHKTVGYVGKHGTAASFTAATLAEAAERMVREFVIPTMEARL